MIQKQPDYLSIGDKVSIVATARSVSKMDLQYAIKVLTDWGLIVVTSENLFEIENQFAGSDELRANDLQKSIDDDGIKAIFVARGGYGTMRIIDKIDFHRFVENPKWIVGFSDITVLHSHIQKNFRIETLHAPMPLTFQWDEDSLTKLKELLFGKRISYKVNHVSTVPFRIGNATAEIIGGNLSILYALQSSESDLITDDKILFIEDLDEYLYHIDRMILSLARAGKFNRLKGLIVGSMADMKDNKIPFGKNANEIIADAVANFDFPVVYNFPSGHDKINMPLILGREITLEVNQIETIVNFTHRK
jgi:muramoyltetrapeptide carboxypeptidase